MHNDLNQTTNLLLSEAPILIVCFVACIVTLAKWKQCPQAALWAFIGFATLLSLGLAAPVVINVIVGWVLHNGQAGRRIWVISALSILEAVLMAIAYVFLLVAVFAGRSETLPPNISVESPPTAP